MISLQPQEQFTIVRQLADHTDPTSYYVQAVIRNSISGETLQTLALNDIGNGRFTKLYEVPADVSGLGFYIDITTSVYTDVDHTTKAPNYGDTNDQYLVFDRTPKGSGGGGADVDYKKIQKMFDKAVEAIPKLKELDLTPLVGMLAEVKKEISSIEMPEIEKINHGPVLDAIEGIEKKITKAISDKKVTPETNLNPLIEKLEYLMKKEPNLEKVTKFLSEIQKVLTDYVKKYEIRESAKTKLKAIQESFGKILQEDIEGDEDILSVKDDRVSKLLQ